MSRRKPKLRRELVIKKLDYGPEPRLNITVATKVRLKGKGSQFIHLDQLKDGNWRLVWTEDIVEDWTKVDLLRMVRGTIDE